MPRTDRRTAVARPQTLTTICLLAGCALAAAATMSGVVLDSRTGEPVPYAWVREPASDARADCDSLGRFTLPLPGGQERTTLEAGRVGYADGRWRRVGPDRTVTLFIAPTSLALKGISVNAFRVPVPQAKAGPVWIL